MDPLGDGPHVGERASNVVLGTGDRRCGVIGRDGDLVDRQSQLADQRRQILLDAVVDVALDASALLVLRLDDAGPRRGDLGGLALRSGAAAPRARRPGSRVRRRRAASRPRAPSSWRSWALSGPPRFGPHSSSTELLTALHQREARGGGPQLVDTDSGGGDDRDRRRHARRAPTAAAVPAEPWRRAARGPRSGRHARPRRRTCRSAGRRCRPRRRANGRPRAPTGRGPGGTGRRPSTPSPRPGRRARCARSSRRRRTRRAHPPPPRIDTRPTPTATFRTAMAASPSSGWTMVVAAPGGHRCPGHRSRERGEEPVADVEEAEQPHELHDGDGTHARHEAERQPSQLAALVDARTEQRSRRAARRPRAGRAPTPAARSRRWTRRR